MSSHYEWGTAKGGLYSLVTRQAAPVVWRLPDVGEEGAVSEPFALGLFTDNGDGTILEGDAAAIVDYVDQLHHYVHRELDSVVDGGARPLVLTNRGSNSDTWTAWNFYRRVRFRFTDWNHVVLTYLDPADADRVATSSPKLVIFVDDQGNRLELAGVNFGYGGGTPGELRQLLDEEGFPSDRTAAVVLNRGGGQRYPQTLTRD